MAKLLAIEPAAVLAVYAHPDDPEISCGGSLIQWAEAGASTHIAICTRGDKGSVDASVDPEALTERRAAEVAAAASVLGARSHHLLGYHDGEIDNTADLRGRLVSLIRALRPDVVVCPDPTAVFFGDRYVNHRDHREVGWAVLDACAPAAASPLYFPEAGPVHQVQTLLLSGTLDPDVWIEIDRAVDRKVEAVLCHASQVGHDARMIADIVRARAEEAGRDAGVRWAEGFRRIRLSG